MPYAKASDTGDLTEYENDLKENDQMYSSMLTDNGFTHMGIANRLQYFLVVPDPKDCNTAYFEGVDYITLFKELSDKDVFDAFVMLNKRDYKKGFTPNLFVKNIGVSLEKANEIISILSKYYLVNSTEVEMDDETQTVYRFLPTPSFPALLIFAREIIKKPNHFAYYTENRKEPYFK